MRFPANAGNYVLVLNRLYHPVDISKCRASVKRDRITLVLAKQVGEEKITRW